MEKLFEHPLTEVEKLPSTYNDKDILYLGEPKLNIPYLFERSVGVGTQLIGPIQLQVKRQNSRICNFFFRTMLGFCCASEWQDLSSTFQKNEKTTYLDNLVF